VINIQGFFVLLNYYCCLYCCSGKFFLRPQGRRRFTHLPVPPPPPHTRFLLLFHILVNTVTRWRGTTNKASSKFSCQSYIGTARRITFFGNNPRMFVYDVIWKLRSAFSATQSQYSYCTCRGTCSYVRQ
jgi:hypothetical protein